MKLNPKIHLSPTAHAYLERILGHSVDPDLSQTEISEEAYARICRACMRTGESFEVVLNRIIETGAEMYPEGPIQ